MRCIDDGLSHGKGLDDFRVDTGTIIVSGNVIVGFSR
jgi:hypothetical protein